MRVKWTAIGAVSCRGELDASDIECPHLQHFCYICCCLGMCFFASLLLQPWDVLFLLLHFCHSQGKLLQCCYKFATKCCSAGFLAEPPSPPKTFRYNLLQLATQLLHSCHNVATPLLQSCYTFATGMVECTTTFLQACSAILKEKSVLHDF